MPIRLLSNKLIAALGVSIVIELGFAFYFLTKGSTFAILEPMGIIAQQQKSLFLFAVVLSLLVIIPVYMLLGFILWRYRESNVTASYKPDWDGSKKLETLWWGIPMIIITTLAFVTYSTSHSLDPYKALASNKKPLTVEVVALQWKWLFIYPEYDIATVNDLTLPVDRPVNFKITSDAPMNSFWIPQLGGQVYAMSGMTTKLHLAATSTGTFDGRSANISGEGFAGMTFKVHAVNDTDFESWHQTVHASPLSLDTSTYQQLKKPSEKEPVSLYKTVKPGLFSDILNQYMAHGSHVTTSSYGGDH